MNLRRTLFALIAAATTTFVCAQINMTVIGQLDYQNLHNSDLSDVWGYTDEFGNEYALVGVNDGGVSVVDLSNPSNPQEIFFYPGPSSIWRDLKVWGDHAYITTEGGGGLAIIDLTPLPQSTNLTAISFQGQGWQSAHNLYIDEFGICYIFGANRGNGGVIFYDLTQDPMNPVEVGEFDTWYCHDGMARGDTLYAAHISDGFFTILDVADKQNVQILGSQTTGNNFSHNIWVSDDGTHVFTTDEVPGGFIGSYDITDPTDIKEVDLTVSDPGTNTIPHNTHVIGDFVFTSYYRYGTTVHDISRPHNVIETGFYDSSPLTGNGFNGSWGAYPYLPSGFGLATDIESGLFVFDVVYQYACYLEGTITDAVTTNPLQGALIEVLSLPITESSSQVGEYATGYHTAGSYDVQVSKAGYVTQTITGVQLTNGVLTQLDVQLQPLSSFTLSGNVLEDITAVGVPNAVISLESNLFSYTVTADGSGNFSLNGVFDDTYDIAIGAWGWNTICTTGVVLNSSTAPLSFNLPVGYMDDFAVDLGWSATANGATTGFWELGEPEGTTFQGTQSNPDLDVNGDCLDKAYVTGNAGGGAGNDDIDGGTVILTSPVMDLSNYISPRIDYYRWFFNAGGQGAANDEARVYLSDGAITVLVETIDASSPMAQWIQAPQIVVSDFITPGSNVQFIVEAEDLPSGHIVEVGLDVFEVNEGPVSVSEIDELGLQIYPNPSVDGQVWVSWHGDVSSIELFDAQGRLIEAVTPTSNMHQFSLEVSGVYTMQITGQNNARSVKKLVVN